MPPADPDDQSDDQNGDRDDKAYQDGREQDRVHRGDAQLVGGRILALDHNADIVTVGKGVEEVDEVGGVVIRGRGQVIGGERVIGADDDDRGILAALCTVVADTDRGAVEGLGLGIEILEILFLHISGEEEALVRGFEQRLCHRFIGDGDGHGQHHDDGDGGIAQIIGVGGIFTVVIDGDIVVCAGDDIVLAVFVDIAVTHFHTVIGEQSVQIRELAELVLIVREVEQVVAEFAVIVEPLGQGVVRLVVKVDVGVIDDDELAVIGDGLVEQADGLDLIGVVLEQLGEGGHILFTLTGEHGHLGLFLGGDVDDCGGERLLYLLTGDDDVAVLTVLILIKGEHISQIDRAVEIAALDEDGMALCPVDLCVGSGESRLGGEIDIMQGDIVGAVFDGMDQLVRLHTVFVVGAVAAFKVGLLLEHIDIDRILDLVEILFGFLLELIGRVLGHVDIQRMGVGDDGEDDVDQYHCRDEQHGQQDGHRAAGELAILRLFCFNRLVCRRYFYSVSCFTSLAPAALLKHSDAQEQEDRDDREEEDNTGDIDDSVDEVGEMRVEGDVVEEGGQPVDVEYVGQ